MAVVHWARHGENVANVSHTFSYRVFDGDLTDGASRRQGGWPRPCGRPGTAIG
jgi:hypothetical protein